MYRRTNYTLFPGFVAAAVAATDLCFSENFFFYKGIFFCFYLFMYRYVIQNCFIRRPSDTTVSEDAGIEHRTVATLTLTAWVSNHSAETHISGPLSTVFVLFLLFLRRNLLLLEVLCLPSWRVHFSFCFLQLSQVKDLLTHPALFIWHLALSVISPLFTSIAPTFNSSRLSLLFKGHSFPSLIRELWTKFFFFYPV